MEKEKVINEILKIRDERMQELEKISEEIDSDKNMNFAKKEILDTEFYKNVGFIKGLNKVLEFLMGSD